MTLNLLNRVASVALLVCITLGPGCMTTKALGEPDLLSSDAEFYLEFRHDPLGISSDIVDWLEGLGFQTRLGKPVRLKALPEPNLGRSTSSGTGFFVGKPALIVTNAHVVSGAQSITAVCTNRARLACDVIAIDLNNDIAILKPRGSTAGMATLTLAPPGSIGTGDPVWVVGYPLVQAIGVHPRVTDGTVSALYGLGDDPTRMQISAPIQPGNSGGPILNEELEVVGIATEKLADLYAIKKFGSVPQNVNFGIKSEYLVPLLGSLQFEQEKLGDLDECASATVILIAESGPPKSTRESMPGDVEAPPQQIIVSFSYSYYFDVFMYQLTRFDMTWKDAVTGVTIARTIHSGEAFGGKGSALRKIFSTTEKKLNLHRAD